ncbi:hypothetical protein N7G274_009303 [Stereocaulon virgatum]|uniref:Uncharacterized protein n=1 Tax=Stereocaulon virgatum TaxID=373712 RepID=A0ABR3ZXI9_9LECA
MLIGSNTDSDIWIHFLPQLPSSGSFDLTDISIVIRDAIRESMDPFRPDMTMPNVPHNWVSGVVRLNVLPSSRARGHGPTLTYGRWISALTGFNGFVHAYPEVAFVFGLWIDGGGVGGREHVAIGGLL